MKNKIEVEIIMKNYQLKKKKKRNEAKIRL